MAQLTHPCDPLGAEYIGLPEFFEFTNGDGRWRPYNCGQAAACTLLSHCGAIKPQEDASELMKAIEQAHPPDNFGGYFGTSRYCVERICRRNGVRLKEVVGEEQFRAALTNCRPVIVMLGVPGPKFMGYPLPAGHWMVAYGFDNEHVYLSNQGRMTWEEFRSGWRSLVPRLIRMNGRGLMASIDQGDAPSVA